MYTMTSFVISTDEVGVKRQTKASTGKKKDLVFGYEKNLLIDTHICLCNVQSSQ